MNFVIAAGGTGGHLFPGVAVGEVLLGRGHRVMVLISEKEIDALATEGRKEFRIERLPGIGLPRFFSPAVFGFLLRFASGLRRCRALYSDFRPDAVLGMGGFTSTGPILVGRARRVPTLVHESNAVAGKANRLNGRLVDRVLLGFDECQRYFPASRCEVTGTPVRRSLIEKLAKRDALAVFGFAAERKTLLVMGGSQGAHGINEAVAQALGALNDLPIQVVHLAGSRDESMLREAYARARVPAFVAAFHHRMEEAYSAADFAIARSGAASLTELSHFAIPAVLVPYPAAADDHQTCNARIFEQGGAAILLPEREANGPMLAGKLRWFLDDPSRLSEMSSRSADLAPRQSAERVAEAVVALCKA